MAPATGPASEVIDHRIRELADWRGETLARMRALILKAVPGITEEWTWYNPVWSLDGIICTGEAYTKVVKLTYAKGASLSDPKRVFNSSRGGNTRRAIYIREGERVDARAFTALVKAAVAENGRSAKKTTKKPASPARAARPEKLNSSGNIHEGDDLDATQLAKWSKWATELPGWVP